MAEQIGQVCKDCLSASLLHHSSQSLHRTIHTPWQFLAKNTVIFCFKRLNTSAKMENASPVNQNI